jgi:hypothetical protein
VCGVWCVWRGPTYSSALSDHALVLVLDSLLQLTANRDNKDKRVRKMLDLLGRPKLWETSKGAVTAVHTPFTTRAKELADLCNGA